MENRSKYRKSMVVGLSITLVALLSNAMASEPIKLGFVVRPGMAEFVNGAANGTYLPPADGIVRAAHLQVQWTELPQSRLVEEVRAGVTNYCAVGAYKTEERLHFAKFSEAFFHDKPLAVVTLKSKETFIRQHDSFAALAADTKFKVGLINGYSYGSRLDPILQKMRNADRMSGSTMQNFSKLVAGRFDYLLDSDLESPRAPLSVNVGNDSIVHIPFNDLAPGEARYFMCSPSVDDATIARINKAIRTLHLPISP